MNYVQGGDGNDFISFGDGNDTKASGDAGNDTIFMGGGDDEAYYEGGKIDGADTIDGGAGDDTITFDATVDSQKPGFTGENLTISANGTHALLFEDAHNNVDMVNVEHIEFGTAGDDDEDVFGARPDVVTINDLTGTDVKEISLDLAAANPNTGDGQVDNITVNATAGADHISLSLVNGDLVISGLSEKITIEHFDLNDVDSHQWLGRRRRHRRREPGKQWAANHHRRR